MKVGGTCMLLLTVEEAVALASRGYYISCRRGNFRYIGYEGRDRSPGK